MSEPKVKEEIETSNEIRIKPEPPDELLLQYLSNNIKIEEDGQQSLHFFCIHCSESFIYPELYELHTVIHNCSRTQLNNCPCCKKQYKSEEKFTLHIQEHLKNFKHCTFCPRIFFNQNTLTRHQLEHKRNGALKCTYCGKVFKETKSLTTHIRVHTNERPYECTFCGKTFKQLSSLNTHKKLKHSEGDSKECHICHGKFCTQSSLNRHMKRHAAGRTIACNTCKQDFFNKEFYNQHKMECHLKLFEFYEVCPDCNEEFFTRGAYFLHRKSHQSQNRIKKQAKTYPKKKDKETCELCGEKLPSNNIDDHKNNHMLMTSEELLECGRSKEFSCKICKAKFSNKTVLFSHMDVHMEKIYKCSKGCNPEMTFTYLGLGKHEIKEHPESKDNGSRNCYLCGIEVLNNEYYNHLNVHIPMDEKELSECRARGEYPCKQCDTTYDTRGYLVQHMVTHMPKTFTCGKNLLCKNNLYTYPALRAHQRIAHHEFSCKHCNKTFTGLNRFKTHKQKHNNDSTTDKFTNSGYTISTFTKKTLKCLLCSANFNNLNAMTNHYQTHKDYSFRCYICDTRYPHALSVQHHMSRRHNQKYNLENCYRYLITKVDVTNLKADPVFTCNWCKATFNTKEAILEHEKTHRYKRGSRFHCNRCKMNFSQPVQQINHIKNNICTKWAVEALISEIKALKCFYCDSIFSRLCDVSKHITALHLKDPYKCRFCDTSHPVESLRTHMMKIHPHKKKYFCLGCNASFVFFKTYLQHRKWCTEYPLSNKEQLKRQVHENDLAIEVGIDNIEEDIVDVPEKVAINANGEIIIPNSEADPVFEIENMDVDDADTII